MKKWFESDIEYAVISQRFGSSQETRVLKEKRRLRAASASLAEQAIAEEVELINNCVHGSLRFINTRPM